MTFLSKDDKQAGIYTVAIYAPQCMRAGQRYAINPINEDLVDLEANDGLTVFRGTEAELLEMGHKL